MIDSKNRSKILVDAVITWVDGSDEKLANKKTKYLSGEKESKIQNVKTRYNQVGEIEYVIKSIIKFAPFINNIFIVTDSQRPKIIDDSNSWRKEYREKLKVVDHKVIFRDFIEFLPTFNSTTIETMLHYIPNLSEHFIYFNDDMFLIKPTKISHWFKNGIPIVSGKWKKLPQKIWYYRLKYLFFPWTLKRAGFKYSQAHSAQIAGYKKKYFLTHHKPRPLLKSHFFNYISKEKKDLIDQIKYRFRNYKQYYSYSLVWHKAINNKSLILKENDDLLEIHRPYKIGFKKVITLLDKNESNKAVFALNIQSLDLVKTNDLKFILKWLKTKTKINLT
jgi:hypothetical protein